MKKITISEFMNNPAGKGSNIIPNRQLIIDDFRRRYKQILEHHKFDVTIYKNKEDYFFHVIVPSEDKDKDVTYDVVIQFTMADEDFKNDISLNRYFVKFFSNCPSFTFTYTYVYAENDLLADGFQVKYRDEVLDAPPVVRNPNEVISFEKSTYFACLHLLDKNVYMNKLYLNTHIRSTNIDALIKKIRTTDTILMQYKRAQNKQKKEKEKLKQEIEKKLKSPIKTNNRGVSKIKPDKKLKPTVAQKKKTSSNTKITAKRSTVKKKK